MLKKGKKSSFLLSAITVLSFSVTSACVNIIIPYLRTGDIQSIVLNPDTFSTQSNVIALIFILSILFLTLILIGAYWLNRFFGERYYGTVSAFRWALFGTLFAILIAAPEWFIPKNLQIVKSLLKFLSVFLAFFISRWIFPLRST